MLGLIKPSDDVVMIFLWNLANKFNRSAFMNIWLLTNSVCLELDYISIKSFILKHYTPKCLKRKRHWGKKDINPRHYVEANTPIKSFKKEKEKFNSLLTVKEI